MWQHLRTWLTHAWAATIRIATRIWHGLAGVVVTNRTRHIERAGHDPAYRSALASGATAVISVVTAQPAIAAALGVLVAEHLRAPTTVRSASSPGPRRLWDEDWDEDDNPAIRFGPAPRWGERY